MEIQEMMALVQEVGVFKPVVSKAIEGLKLYEEEFKQIQDFIINETVDSRSRIFKGFVDNGFSREEAMTLTLASVKEFKEAVNNVKRK